MRFHIIWYGMSMMQRCPPGATGAIINASGHGGLGVGHTVMVGLSMGFCGLLVMGMSKAPSRLMGLGVHANSLRFGFVVIQ